MTEFSDGTDRELEKCMPNEVNEAMIVHHYGIKGEPDHSYDKWARRGGIEAWKKHVESIHGDRVKFSSGEGVWTHAHSGDRKVGSYSSYNHSSETLNKRIDEAKKFKFDPLRFKKSEASKHKWDDWHGVSRTGYVKRVTKDKRAIAKMKNTEVNEVSRDTLKRYYGKAKSQKERILDRMFGDRDDSDGGYGYSIGDTDRKTLDKRDAGMVRARKLYNKKAANESVEVNETKMLGKKIVTKHRHSLADLIAKRDKHASARDALEKNPVDAKSAHKTYRHHQAAEVADVMRRGGMFKNAGWKTVRHDAPKTTTESVEVNEVSSGLMRSYRWKAHSDLQKRASGSGSHPYMGDGSYQQNTFRKIKNRADGLLKTSPDNIKKKERQEKDRRVADFKAKHGDDVGMHSSHSGWAMRHTPGDEESEKKLADLKSGKQKGQRVIMRGRLGKNSPHAHLYSSKGGPLHRYSGQTIKPEHSKYFDVYVKNRRTNEAVEVKDAQVVDGAKREGRARKRFLSPMGAEKLVADKNRVDEDSIVEVSASKLGRYIKASHRDQEERKSSGQKWAREVRAQTGLHVGAPFDRKVYSSKHGREAYRNLALKKLTGKARVEAN